MIFKDFDKFVQYIPTAAGTEAAAMETFLQEAEIWIKNELLGTPLYSHIEGLENTDVVRAAEVVICLKAYLSAIPFADLIQTPNGFAVVSNSNHAPASKERVERLIEFVKLRLSKNQDNLITIIFHDNTFHDKWSKSDLFERFTSIVYLTGRDLDRFANVSVTFGTLDSAHGNILLQQDELSKYISPEYMTILFKKFRECSMTGFDKKVFVQLKVLVGLMLQKMETYPMIEKLVNFMVENIGEFPDFKTSQTYKLKFGTKYENSPSDTTFFFGG